MKNNTIKIENKGHLDGYNHYLIRKRLFLLLLLFIMIAVSIISIASGSSGLTIKEVLTTIAGKGTSKTNAIVWNVRMPRIITSIVVGIALALTGCVMQSVLHNPLASASTLGVSQGASFGATVAIICFSAGAQHNATASGAVTISNPYIVTICAFIGGIISVIVILGLSRIRMITPASMVLAGLALSSLFRGGTTLLQYFADDVVLAAVVFWTFGDLARASWQEIFIIIITLVITFIYFLYNSWSYNALQNGIHTAKSLGINVDRLVLISMALGALLSATVTSFVGIISFIGLVAPHIARKFVGNDYRFLLPASALMGACVLLISDLFGRTIAAPVILPIGAITSFLGAPLFLYLIYKGAK